MSSRWPAPSPDRYLNVGALPYRHTGTPSRLVVVWHWQRGPSLQREICVTSAGEKKEKKKEERPNMSSLLKPFSVCEGPCENCGLRRGCTKSAPHQRSAPHRLAAARLAALPAHQRSYSARRNLAAAAIGGRKITHPGKAILAGGFLQRVYSARTFPPSHSRLLRSAPRSLISICR